MLDSLVAFFEVAFVAFFYCIPGFFVGKRFAQEMADDEPLWVLATPLVAAGWPVAVVVFYLVIPYLDSRDQRRGS